MRDVIQHIQHSLWYNVGISLLAVLSALLLVYELVRPDIDAVVLERILTFDLIVAYLFLVDFFVGVAVAYNRRRYVRNNWLNFVSSVPLSGEVWRAFRVLRIARALRLVRVAVNAQQAARRARQSKQ